MAVQVSVAAEHTSVVRWCSRPATVLLPATKRYIGPGSCSTSFREAYLIVSSKKRAVREDNIRSHRPWYRGPEVGEHNSIINLSRRLGIVPTDLRLVENRYGENHPFSILK